MTDVTVSDTILTLRVARTFSLSDTLCVTQRVEGITSAARFFFASICAECLYGRDLCGYAYMRVFLCGVFVCLCVFASICAECLYGRVLVRDRS